MLAQRFGASVRLFHAFDPAPLGRATPFFPFHMSREDIEREVAQRVGEQLAELRSELTGPDVELVARLQKSAAAAICEHAEESGIDLVVLGRRGHSGIQRMLIGGVAEKVVRHAPCSVLAVAQEERPFDARELLVAVDFSSASLYACEVAAAWAVVFGGRLTLVHVAAPPSVSAAVPVVTAAPLPLGTPLPMEDINVAHGAVEAAHESLEAVRAERCAQVADVACEVIEHPNVWQAISRRAGDNVDVVVLGSYGHGTLERVLLGSVAEKLVRHVACSTLAVRPPSP
jgi:nucleotide-binding universal stress UspA family protein